MSQVDTYTVEPTSIAIPEPFLAVLENLNFSMFTHEQFLIEIPFLAPSLLIRQPSLEFPSLLLPVIVI